MNIKDIKGYDEFKKHCNFELCTKRYPDWVGSEKYIVITDDAEKDLLEAFPEIMKALSPYVIIGRFFNQLNEEERYNTTKHISQIGFSIDYVDDYEDLAEGFIEEDFAEQLCISESVLAAMESLTDRQKERIRMYFFEGLSTDQIAAAVGISRQSIEQSLALALKKMKKNTELIPA